jgi:undecaprenyl-diphosphatase
MTSRRRLILALALLLAVFAIGLLKHAGLFAPLDGLLMGIVGVLRRFPGAGLATNVSELLARLGEGGGRLSITLALGFFLARAGRAGASMWLLVATAGITLINPLMKLIFLVPRPDAIEHLVTVTSHSYPSGHAAGAMALWGGIALLFPNRLVRLLCAAMVLATGLSRVWLGVHWPSDVAGGWLEGAAWLLLLSLFLPPDEGQETRDSSMP